MAEGGKSSQETAQELAERVVKSVERIASSIDTAVNNSIPEVRKSLDAAQASLRRTQVLLSLRLRDAPCPICHTYVRRVGRHALSCPLQKYERQASSAPLNLQPGDYEQ